MLVLFNSFLLTMLSTNSFSQAETNLQKNSPKTFTKSKEEEDFTETLLSIKEEEDFTETLLSIKEEEDFTETLLSIKGVKAPTTNKIGILKKIDFQVLFICSINTNHNERMGCHYHIINLVVPN